MHLKGLIKVCEKRFSINTYGEERLKPISCGIFYITEFVFIALDWHS